MKWVGWIGFFLVIVGLLVGGFFLLANFEGETFKFKEVEILDYGDFTINDLVEQDIICNDKGCKFKDKDVIFTISDVKDLGKQDILLEIEYEGEKFSNTFSVDVVDRSEPIISLSETSLILDADDKFDASSYILSVKDNYDELNIEDITIVDDVDLKKAGDYEVVYKIKDSSGNEGKTTLKVKNKNKKDVGSSNNEDKKPEKEKITLDYSISGLFSDSGTLLQGKTISLVNKDIELGWDNTLKFTSKIDASGKINYIISKKEITGNELTPIGGKGLPAIGGGSVKSLEETSFSYTFTDAGTYYVSIVVFDEDNNILIKKDFCLNLSISEEVKDMKITTEDKGSYVVIDCSFIGGGDNEYYFVPVITDSNDPKASEEEIMVLENNEIRLYYTKGYYYEIAGMLVDEDEELVTMKTIKIEK